MERLLPLTAKTITDRDELEAQFGDVRRRGFAETVDELEDGFSGVGAVVRGSTGEILGALVDMRSDAANDGEPAGEPGRHIVRCGRPSAAALLIGHVKIRIDSELQE